MLNLRNVLFAGTALLVGVVLLVGCSSQNVSQPATGPSSSPDWKAGLDEDVVTALSQLTDADRIAALAQKVCPVTDKPLGSMGKPPKVTVEGRDMYLCCGGCEDELKNNAAKYLAKLNAE